MKFNLKKSTLIIALAGVLVVAATATAAVAVAHKHEQGQSVRQGEGFRHGPWARNGLGPLFHSLNLTADQKTQIKQIADSFKDSNKALHEQMKALRGSAPNPMSGTFDEAAVRAAAEARAKVQVELAVSRAKMMSQIAGVLTPDQKTQLAAKRAAFVERQGHRQSEAGKP